MPNADAASPAVRRPRSWYRHLRHRNQIRAPEEQFFFDGYKELRATMRSGFGDLGWWFDTSDRVRDGFSRTYAVNCRVMDRRPLRSGGSGKELHMSEASTAATGGLAGGTPSESDLPSMQGLGDSVDDPSDPTAARDDDANTVGAEPEASSGDDAGPSDPMPDISGTSASR